MTTKPAARSIDEVKAQAKRMRAKLMEEGHAITHSQSLEIMARQLGHKDWNTLYAMLGNHPPVCPLVIGQRVEGTYLGQGFSGEVLGLVQLHAAGMYRVTIHFDDPVDVVVFDSFSAFRQRVSATITADGISPEKTSNGNPQIMLHL